MGRPALELGQTAQAERGGWVPAFGRVGFGGKRIGPGDLSAEERVDESPALSLEVNRLGHFGSREQRARVADAVSLRGAGLVAALIARFEGDTDEALAALEDYAGAFDSLADFAREVFAERHPMAPCPEALNAEAMGQTMLERGEVFALRLGLDIHLFWRV